MSHIYKNIYLGNRKDFRDCNFIKDNNIKYALNVKYNKEKNKCKNIDYKHVPAYDDLCQDGVKMIKKSFPFIISAVSNNKNILIFCHAGISRSSFIVISFLIIYYNFSLTRAYNLTLKKRDIIHPNKNFMILLEKIDKHFKKKGK